MPDVLALWGDATDNIPGVPGIGEKTAKKLVKAIGVKWVRKIDSYNVADMYQALIEFEDIFGAGPGLIPVGSPILDATLDFAVLDSKIQAGNRRPAGFRVNVG